MVGKKNKISIDNSIRLNRRVITFLFCVAISVFFWLLMTLSRQYTITVNFPVNYINLPFDKVVSNRLPESIDIQIESSGFNLLWYKIKHQREVISIDLKDVVPLAVKNHYYLLSNSRIDKITAQFSNEIKIVRVIPDTVFLNFNKKTSKRVPVKPSVTINFQNQFQQKDSIILTPAFVDISGAADIVDKINSVETMPVTLKNVTTSVSVELSLKKTPLMKYVDLSQPTVMATLNVTRYTEANIELPIEVENLPLGLGLKTFPDKVSVKYNVAFTNYEKINSSQFRAVVDYKKIETGNNKLKVLLVTSPSEIKAVKLNPEKVEFIIKK